MKTGRPPIPTNLKLLRGTAQPSRINPAEPKPPVVDAVPPRTASRRAKRYWKEIAPQLRAIGVLTRVDQTALLLLCEAFAEWIEATEKLKEHGVLIRSNTGVPAISPWHKVATSAHERVVRLLAEFGMTPSSRTRVSSVGGPRKNEFADD